VKGCTVVTRKETIMPTIKFHVDHEEMSALRRRAEALNISVAELAYGALNCSMSHGKEAYCVGRIRQAIKDEGGDLPLWSDSARSIGIYEGQPDLRQVPGPRPMD